MNRNDLNHTRPSFLFFIKEATLLLWNAPAFLIPYWLYFFVHLVLITALYLMVREPFSTFFLPWIQTRFTALFESIYPDYYRFISLITLKIMPYLYVLCHGFFMAWALVILRRQEVGKGVGWRSLWDALKKYPLFVALMGGLLLAVKALLGLMIETKLFWVLLDRLGLDEPDRIVWVIWLIQWGLSVFGFWLIGVPLVTLGLSANKPLIRALFEGIFLFRRCAGTALGIVVLPAMFLLPLWLMGGRTANVSMLSWPEMHLIWLIGWIGVNVLIDALQVGGLALLILWGEGQT